MQFRQTSFLKTSILTGAFMFLALISCKKDEDTTTQPTGQYTVTATASGAQEVPAVTTNGSGTLNGTYNSNTKILNYTLNWIGLSGPATLMHFHGPALTGVSAGVELGIRGFTSAASGSLTRADTLNSTQETDLLSGKWYWNIHTAANGGGEIRGQVAVR